MAPWRRPRVDFEIEEIVQAVCTKRRRVREYQCVSTEICGPIGRMRAAGRARRCRAQRLSESSMLIARDPMPGEASDALARLSSWRAGGGAARKIGGDSTRITSPVLACVTR